MGKYKYFALYNKVTLRVCIESNKFQFLLISLKIKRGIYNESPLIIYENLII